MTWTLQAPMLSPKHPLLVWKEEQKLFSNSWLRDGSNFLSKAGPVLKTYYQFLNAWSPSRTRSLKTSINICTKDVGKPKATSQVTSHWLNEGILSEERSEMYTAGLTKHTGRKGGVLSFVPVLSHPWKQLGKDRGRRLEQECQYRWSPTYNGSLYDFWLLDGGKVICNQCKPYFKFWILIFTWDSDSQYSVRYTLVMLDISTCCSSQSAKWLHSNQSTL